MKSPVRETCTPGSVRGRPATGVPAAMHKMNDRTKYQKWVGVLLGLLVNGSAHFLSGTPASGVKWYFSIVVCVYLSLVITAIPGIATYVLGLLVLSVLPRLSHTLFVR